MYHISSTATAATTTAATTTTIITIQMPSNHLEFVFV